MGERLDYVEASPQGYKALAALDGFVERSGIDPMLLALVQLRASQINGCAYCLDMHSKDLLAMGEDPVRIHTLSAWRETPFFSERERAALRWTEEITLINEGHAPDDAYEEVRRHFNDEELVNLTLAIATIGAWNRLSIAFRGQPGTYQSSRQPLAAAAG